MFFKNRLYIFNNIFSFWAVEECVQDPRHSGVGTILQWYRFFLTALTLRINLYVISKSQLSITPEWIVFQIVFHLMFSPKTFFPFGLT